MSESPLIDLSGVLRPDIRVKFDPGAQAKVYRLPGDPPNELWLRLGMLLGELGGLEEDSPPSRALELREELTDSIYELFRLRQDVEDGDINLTDAQIVALFNQLAATYATAVEEAAPERPTSPASTSPKRRSSRRSASGRTRSAARASSTSSQT